MWFLIRYKHHNIFLDILYLLDTGLKKAAFKSSQIYCKFDPSLNKMSTHFIWFKIDVIFFFYCFFLRPYIVLFLSASGFTFPRYYTISIILGAVIFSSSRDRLWSYIIILSYYMLTCLRVTKFVLGCSLIPFSLALSLFSRFVIV